METQLNPYHPDFHQKHTHVAGANVATLAGYAAVIGNAYKIEMTIVNKNQQ
jgi:hypothetical protein